MCLGASSISKKSTAVKFVETLMNGMEMQEGALPGSFSPESFIEILSDNEHGYLLLDEAGALLANMQKTYMQEMRDVFSKLYDNTGQCRQLRTSQRTGKHKFKVENPFITQMYATTPSNFAAYTNGLDLTSGYLLRFLYFNPSYKTLPKPFELKTATSDSEYAALKAEFEKVKNLFINYEIEFVPNDEALQIFQKWQLDTEQKYYNNNVDEITLSGYGRLNIYVLKLAMIYQIADVDFINDIGLELESKPYMQEYDSVKECYISAEYMQLAIKHVEEYFLPSFVEVAGLVIKNKTNNAMDKMLNLLKEQGGKCQRTKIMQQLHISKFDLDNIVESLLESEEIIEIKEKGTNGKGVIYYCLNV